MSPVTPSSRHAKSLTFWSVPRASPQANVYRLQVSSRDCLAFFQFGTGCPSAILGSEATLSYHEAEGYSASTKDTAQQMLYMDSEGLDPLIKQ